MNVKTGIYAIFFMFLAQVGVSVVSAAGVNAPTVSVNGQSARLIQADKASGVNKFDSINFKHGDVSWLGEMALSVGWPQKQIPRLKKIVLRESGGCPNRIGGSVVDKDCNIVKMATMSHPSDSGLLQINGVNYDKSRNKWALLCNEMKICTQEPLLDAETNLKAGLLLWRVSGWGPWDPCAWGPEYDHRCKKGE